MEDKVRILLVEDFPPDAELEILEIKKEIPCSEFLVVDTKKKFLEALEHFAPHVIVSDYMMPQFNGMSALKLTQERTTLIPFILCTGSMNEDTAVECMKMGATDYIIKEHMKRLGESIRSALEQSKILIQKKEAEISLAQSNERFRIIQEYSPIGIATVDEKGFFIDSNTAYQEMFCLPPHFPLKKLNLFTMKILTPDLKKRLEQGEIVRIENTFLMTEMETFYQSKLNRTGKIDLEFFIKAVETDPENHTQEFIVQVMDITERKRVENLKNEFINMISHELRTPLTSMAQSMSIMKKHYLQNLSADQTNLIDMFLRNTTRLSKIMQDILDFQKLNSATLEFNLKPDSVNEVIQQIMEEFKTFSTNQDIVIITQLEENLHDVLIDRERLSQVFINLISNALKFTEKGKVTIQTEMDTQKNQIKVSVEDTGIGINQEELRQIFVPFYQAKKDMEHKTGGTGLGLTICKKILEGHGSDLQVLSEPGKGSIFFFSLPLAITP